MGMPDSAGKLGDSTVSAENIVCSGPERWLTARISGKYTRYLAKLLLANDLDRPGARCPVVGHCRAERRWPV